MNSQQSGQNIFKKVPVSEKKFLFRELAHDKLQVSCKGDDEVFFNLIAIQTEKDEDLLCHHTANSKAVEKNQLVVVNFQFKNERYFFHTELSFSTGWAVLKIDGDLFQLQRRSNARVDLPDKYDSSFTLHAHQGQKYFLDAKILDISAGGLKILLAGDIPAMKVGDKIRGTMRLGIRRSMEFEMEVRFTQRSETEGRGVQTAGVQFLNIDKTMENRLLVLMMDLQREIFLKYPSKK